KAQAFIHQTERQLIVHDDFFIRIPKFVQTDVLHLSLEEIGINSISTAALQEVLELIHAQKGKKVQLSPSLEVIREDYELVFIPITQTDFEPFSIANQADFQLLEHIHYSFEWLSDPPKTSVQDGSLFLNFNRISFPLQLRMWQAGDVFQPLGMSGHKLVSDFITDAKIPSHVRKNNFVLSNFDGLIHAVIFAPPFSQNNRVAEQLKCTKSCTHILRIFPNNQI